MTARCDRLVDAGCRKFLTGASVAAAAAASALGAPQAKAATAAGVNYPSSRLGNVHDLKVNEAVNVSYLDADAPGVLIKLGVRVPSGAARMATSSASPPYARTRASRSLTTRPTAR